MDSSKVDADWSTCSALHTTRKAHNYYTFSDYCVALTTVLEIKNFKAGTTIVPATSCHLFLAAEQPPLLAQYSQRHKY